jgi:hypothetical protein
MSKLPKWLRNEKQRKVVGFVFTGIATIVAASWAAYVYFNKPAYGVKATYTVCVGPDDGRKWCPAGSVFLVNKGGNTVSDWAKAECSSYSEKHAWSVPAKECNCFVSTIVCSN